MYVTQQHAQEAEALNVHLLDDVNQLARLGQCLPAHIFGTVLPLVGDEIASGAAELNAQVEGTRQLLLQSAVLRRSTVLAPLLKQQLVTRAIQLQRRRAQLVQQLQRQIRHWRSAPPGVGAASVSSGGGPYRRGGPLSGSAAADPAHTGEGALRGTWATLREAFRFEEGKAHLVQAPLCPSAAALRALLAEVVAGGQSGLHRRVVEQVAGTSPHHGQSPTTASPSTGALGSSPKGDRDADMGGSGGSAEDAIEAALQLLLRYARQTRAEETRVDRTAARGRAPRSGASLPTPASSAPLTGATAFQASEVDGRLQASDLTGVCNVDVRSDDAEEDVFESSPALRHQSATTSADEAPGRDAASPTTQTTSAAGAAPEEASMWLRVPGILPLGQYCAELPWVADLADQRYTEARERRKHGNGGAGEVGYISRHVQPGEQGSGEGVEGREARYEAGYIAPTPAALQMMPPIGYLFAPALAGGSVGSACSSGESVVGRAMRHAAGGAAGAPGAAPADFHADREGASSAQEEERSWLARVVVKCVSAAVDAAWQNVEETVVAPFCAQRRRDFSSRVLSAKAALAAADTGASARGGEAADDEEEVITQFMEVLRVRYAVELAAQVLAARHATELLLDSEDSVIFAERRLVSLVVGGGASVAAACSGGRGTAAAQRASPSPAPVLTCTVLSLPGVKEIFYVLAYCTGAALLCDVAAAAAAFGDDVGGRRGGAGARQRQEYLMVDVDAEDNEEEDLQEERHPGKDDNRLTDGPRRVRSPSAAQRADLANEEDPVARRQASLQAWATLFEAEYLRGCHNTAAFADAPWSAGPASVYSSWSLAPYYRLWLYMWEYVLIVEAPAPSSANPLHSGGAGLAQLPVELRTARRWMEKVIRASVMHGCAEAGLLVSSATPASLAYEPTACLQAHLSAEQTERLMQATTVQARHALLHVSGAGGGAGTAYH
ncbi:conserved hypothetical protein [Leishmania infantum JPCM5]|uniref:Uncharacterized protein n=2 Tax=Leishmania infantum TaxID=5671 RepID=E9AH62_LEIIN|nr:conserved hypothetical protein [Leishmania infantum JPCM5]CAC9492096.1 hypothetical_protein_-_conserved [Leishmania infantum]CBZ08731.1 conserved hypothetical protein [Leishmania infantum JPCM5]SUZ42242.1 hypothetical_protein_-_conserved [Leishmania infantum]|eukprot:XP_003392563.1 conserved hypothetical protein [Leishmania infantum JPCM5]